MKGKMNKSISQFVLILALTGQALLAQADSSELNPVYKQELIKELTINAETLFHNIDDTEIYDQSTKVTNNKSNSKPINYFSIINMIVKDALNPGNYLKASATKNRTNSTSIQVYRSDQNHTKTDIISGGN